MKKLSKKLYGAGLIALAFSLSSANVAAQTCTTPPTCAELGYTKTSCDGFVSLKCPFDKTKLFCGGTCESGYIYGIISGKCGTENPDIIYSGSRPIAVAINDYFAIALKDEAHGTFQEVYDACDNKTGGNWTIPDVSAFQIYTQRKSTIDALIKQVGGNAPSGLYATDGFGSNGDVVEYNMSTGQTLIDSGQDADCFTSRCFMYLK